MNKTTRKPFTLDRIVRIIIVIIIMVCAGLLINRLRDVLLPFLVAWLLAYLMYPLLNFFQYKLHIKNRILAIVCVLITVFGSIFLALFLLIPPVIDETQKAIAIINNLMADSNFTWEIPPAIMETIQNFLKNISLESIDLNNIESLTKTLLPRLGSIISGAGGVILNIFLVFMVLLYLIFILKDYENISNDWINIIPKHYRPFVLELGEDLKSGMNKYFRGQALIAFFVGILFAIGFSIIKLPMGIIFGLLVGAMNMVPYLQTVGMIPGIMLAAIKAAEYDQNFLLVVISVLAVFAIVQVIEEVFLTPKIMGDATGLNPAIILLSLSIWGSLFGVVGMILALPMTTLIISYYKRFVIKGGIIEDLILDPEANTQEKDEKNPASEQDTIDS